MVDIRTALQGERISSSEHRGDVARHLLSSAEVARFCSVPREEVLGWIDSGRLKASYLPVDRYRIDVGDLIAFLHKYELAI